MQEVGERAFLFGGKHGANAHHFALKAAVVYEDLLGALYTFERPSRPLGVGCSIDDFLPDGHKLFGIVGIQKLLRSCHQGINCVQIGTS